MKAKYYSLFLSFLILLGLAFYYFSISQNFPKPLVFWKFYVGDVIGSSPVIGDVNGDGFLDIIFGCDNGCLYAINGINGSLIWKFKTNGFIQSSPALIDFNGTIYIVFGSYDGNIYLLFGLNGSPVWVYPTRNAIYSSPLIIFNDQSFLIVQLSSDGYLYFINGLSGKLVKRIYVGYSDSSPSYFDVDGDNVSEVIVFGNSKLYVIDLKDYSINSTMNFYGNPESSPVVYDVNNDGFGEIFIGYMGVYCLSYSKRGVLWKFGEYYTMSTPALGDIDMDGILEIVIGLGQYITVLKSTNGTLLWSYKTRFNVDSSPVIGDIDGDGFPDIVIGSNDFHVYALKGIDGSVIWIFKTNGVVGISPALGDIDNDGIIEVIVGGDDGYIYALKTPGAKPCGNIIWPCFKGNSFHTGSLNNTN